MTDITSGHVFPVVINLAQSKQESLPVSLMLSEGFLVTIDDRNRMAIQGLLADAERVLVLIDFQDVRGNKEMVEDTIANARQNYIDLVRRSRPLIMSHGEQMTLQEALNRLKERLRFFGDAA